MMYKIFGPPGLHVYDREKRYRGFVFDENGAATAPDNPFVRRVASVYRHEVIDDAAPAPVPASVQIFKCKKCGFQTGNKGMLMAHYREHKQKGE